MQNSFSSDTVVNFGDETQPKRLLRHPLAVGFHLLFKTVAVLIYLFCEWFSSNFIANFLCIIIFLSLDFWAVKNVTGRLLAGMRWWSFVDGEGKNHWKFESRKETSKDSVLESRIFWLAVVLCPALWSLFVFVTLFTLKPRWLLVNFLALGMTGANLYGYLRCRWSSRQEVSSYISQSFAKSILGRLLTSGSSTQNQTGQR